jgi:hypothetical protein
VRDGDERSVWLQGMWVKWASSRSESGGGEGVGVDVMGRGGGGAGGGRHVMDMLGGGFFYFWRVVLECCGLLDGEGNGWRYMFVIKEWWSFNLSCFTALWRHWMPGLSF